MLCSICGTMVPGRYLLWETAGWEHFRSDGGPDRLVNRRTSGRVACRGCAVVTAPSVAALEPWMMKGARRD